MLHGRRPKASIDAVSPRHPGSERANRLRRIEVRHLNCGTMCPIGRRILLGEGGLLAKAKLVAHCLLIEAGGELVLVDTGYGLGDCTNPGRLGLRFRTEVRP